MSRRLPAFGTPDPGQDYILRPGAYGIAQDDRGNVLIITVGTIRGFPGGGLLEGESLEEALVREYREETGYEIEIDRYLCDAGQYVYVSTENSYFLKVCHFYQVTLRGTPGPVKDLDHESLWVPIEEALETLFEEAHRWALEKFLGRE